MRTPLRWSVLMCSALAGAASLVMNAHRPASAQLAPRVERAADVDTSAFSTVLRAMVDSERFPFAVDPRPLRPDTTVWDVTPTSRVIATPAKLEERRAIMRQLRLAEGDGERPAHCSTVMDSYDPHGSHSGCPRALRHVVSVGEPFQVDASGGSSYSHSDPRWTTRAILAVIGPGGVSLEIHDYLMHRTKAGWCIERVTKYFKE